MKRPWIAIAAIICFAIVPAQAQDEKDGDEGHDIWFSDDMDGQEVFVWMNDLDVPELPELPEMPMFEFRGESDGDAAGMEMMLPDDDDLKITRDQREKMRQIRQDVKKKNIPLEADIKLKRLELQELMRADAPSKDMIAAKVKEIDAIKTQIKLNRMYGHIDARNVLTKEQRDKVREMRSMHNRRWNRFHEMHGLEGREGPRKMKRFMQLEKE